MLHWPIRVQLASCLRQMFENLAACGENLLPIVHSTKKEEPLALQLGTEGFWVTEKVVRVLHRLDWRTRHLHFYFVGPNDMNNCVHTPFLAHRPLPRDGPTLIHRTREQTLGVVPRVRGGSMV